jgi:very-short-patch-repair endonuclease
MARAIHETPDIPGNVDLAPSSGRSRVSLRSSSDLLRAAVLVAAGWRVTRVTPSRLAAGAKALAANLRQLLS